MKSAHEWLVQLLLFVTLTTATPSNWTKPNSRAPSFTDTYTVGERIFVSWMSLNDSINDLWLTRYDPNVDDFSLRLAVARNISIADSFDWTIAVNATEVDRDTRFVLQFLPTGAAYNASQIPQLPSPPFNLINLNQASLPNGTIGAPSVTSTISSTSSTQLVVEPTQSTDQSNGSSSSELKSSGFSKSIAIGVSIGAVVLALASMIGALFVVRAYKRSRPVQDDSVSESESGELKASGPYEVLGTSRQPTEMSAKETAIHELNSSKETIVSESDSSTIYEMSTTTKRPGLHELPG